MKLKLDPKILNIPFEEQLQSHLKDAKDMEDKIYLSIAYFQYINKLSVNKAVTLFKEYILSDGQKSTYFFEIYYTRNGKIITKKVDIPLKVDEFLSQYIPEIMNNKDLVAKIDKSKYIKAIKKLLNINASDITAYVIYKMINDIGIHNLVSLRKHWALFSRDLLPYLLKNKAQL
jgi:hypothetical protein